MKTGRNDQCPCGSGKKYKKCCLISGEAISREPFEPLPAGEIYINDYDCVQFFGYDNERPANQSPFELPEEGLCCMVSLVNEDIQNEINSSLNYPLLQQGQGQWIITANDDDTVKFSGPYGSAEMAMNMAAEKFGALRFVSVPDFI